MARPTLTRPPEAPQSKKRNDIIVLPYDQPKKEPARLHDPGRANSVTLQVLCTCTSPGRTKHPRFCDTPLALPVRMAGRLVGVSPGR